MEACFFGSYFLCIANTGVCVPGSTAGLYFLGAKLRQMKTNSGCRVFFSLPPHYLETCVGKIGSRSKFRFP